MKAILCRKTFETRFKKVIGIKWQVVGGPDLSVGHSLEGDDVPGVDHGDRVTVVHREDEANKVGVHHLVAVLGTQIHMASQIQIKIYKFGQKELQDENSSVVVQSAMILKKTLGIDPLQLAGSSYMRI